MNNNKGQEEAVVIVTATGAGGTTTTNRQRLINQPKSASLGSSGSGQHKVARPAGPATAVSFEGRRYREVLRPDAASLSPTKENLNNGVVAFNKVYIA